MLSCCCCCCGRWQQRVAKYVINEYRVHAGGLWRWLWKPASIEVGLDRVEQTCAVAAVDGQYGTRGAVLPMSCERGKSSIMTSRVVTPDPIDLLPDLPSSTPIKRASLIGQQAPHVPPTLSTNTAVAESKFHFLSWPLPMYGREITTPRKWTNMLHCFTGSEYTADA